MSNSIWKTGSPKGIHEEDRLGDYYVAEFHREDGSSFYEAGGTCDICGIPDRWTFLTDLIAQADKAERLQKEITQELDIYYSPNPSLHPADDCVYAIEKIIGYKRKKSNN